MDENDFKLSSFGDQGPIRSYIGYGIHGDTKSDIFKVGSGNSNTSGISVFSPQTKATKRSEVEVQEGGVYIDYIYRNEDVEMEADEGQNHSDALQKLIREAYWNEDLNYVGTWGAQFGEGESRSNCGFFTQSNDQPW